MTEDNSGRLIFTNTRIFYSIAKESLAEMDVHFNADRRPKPNNEPGWIITFDPDQKSFKSALITIVFCGIFLEAILHLLIVKHNGIEIYKQYDHKTYEDKLKLLGCDDETIMKLCEHFRNARREIVHEKAHLDQKSLRIAQDEAKKSMELIDKVVAYFKLDIG